MYLEKVMNCWMLKFPHWHVIANRHVLSLHCLVSNLCQAKVSLFRRVIDSFIVGIAVGETDSPMSWLIRGVSTIGASRFGGLSSMNGVLIVLDRSIFCFLGLWQLGRFDLSIALGATFLFPKELGIEGLRLAWASQVLIGVVSSRWVTSSNNLLFLIFVHCCHLYKKWWWNG